MLKRLLITLFMTVFISCFTGNAYALDKTNIHIAIDDSLAQYGQVNIKTVSLGRTNRETVTAVDGNAYFRHFLFLNYIYTDQVLVNASWYARGEQANPVMNTSLIISESTMRERSRNGGINLLFYPDRIEIQ